MIGWLLVYLVHSTAIYAAAAVVSRHVRAVSAAEALWRTAMLLPIVSATASAMWQTGFWTVHVPGLAPDLLGISRTAQPDGAGTLPMRGLTLDAVVSALWFTAALLLLVRDNLGRALYLRRLERRDVPGGRAALILDRMRRRANIPRPVRLTSSALLGSPLAIGDREVCIPPRAEALEDQELEALLAHELKHLIRHDNRWLKLVGSVESVFFVQPLHRLARRKLQYLAERQCDRWAAEQIADAYVMARCLVTVAGWPRTRHPSSIAAMAEGGLTSRIEHLLQDAEKTDPSVPSSAWAGAVAVVLVLLPSIAAQQVRAPSGGRPQLSVVESAAPSTAPLLEPPAAAAVKSPPASRRVSKAPRRLPTEPRTSGPVARQSAEYLAGFEAARRFRAGDVPDEDERRAVEGALASQPRPLASPTPRRLDAAARAALERSLLTRR